MLSWTQRANYQLCKLRSRQAWVHCSPLLGRSRGQKKLGWEGGQEAWESQASSTEGTEHTKLHGKPLPSPAAESNREPTPSRLRKNSTPCLQVEQEFKRFGFYLATNPCCLCGLGWITLAFLGTLEWKEEVVWTLQGC